MMSTLRERLQLKLERLEEINAILLFAPIFLAIARAEL